jgi:predicted ATPase
MQTSCHCPGPEHDGRLVVLTGGPGAGKTAVLEVIRRNFCEHVAVLPEAATIVFSGGFPRAPSGPLLRAAQRAIYQVQRELERGALERHRHAVILCDRGTIDGLAYWPGEPTSFWSDVSSSPGAELKRYHAVIHLRSPDNASGYNHDNPVRIESADEAARADARIYAAWEPHPRRVVIPAYPWFLDKLEAAIEAVRQQVPPCCRGHAIPELERRPRS